MREIFNFCAGPAMLPKAVMQQAQQEFINWNSTGCSVMELSHRSAPFIALAKQAEADLRELLSVPDNYAVLFCHGGGRGQFSSVPMNLLGKTNKADYVVSGSWSVAAAKEAQKYGEINVIDVVEERNGTKQVIPFDSWSLSSDAAYVHYCPNETVDGIEMLDIPNVGDIPLVADMSSTILSHPIDVSKFGLIYAGAQKNIGPSGLTLVIVRHDLLDQSMTLTPEILRYKTIDAKESMYNTPPTYAWYLASLVFTWLKQNGGVTEIENINQQKAQLLYQAIDSSDFYQNNVAVSNRSRMNVVFNLTDETLNEEFLSQAEAHGLLALEGHRSVGGMRASIYNAMPLEGVQKLVNFMQKFEQGLG